VAEPAVTSLAMFTKPTSNDERTLAPTPWKSRLEEWMRQVDDKVCRTSCESPADRGSLPKVAFALLPIISTIVKSLVVLSSRD